MKTNQEILRLLDLLKEKGIAYQGVSRPQSADLSIFHEYAVFELKVRGNTFTIETHSTEEALKSLLDTLKIEATVQDMVALRRVVVPLEEAL